MWPVIIRELQAEARHPFTYWMRSLGAGALLLVGAYFALDSGFFVQRGGLLFARLHLALFCSIWMLVPLVTADCLSRERREGTLGLLFLTPLTPRTIVLAKALVHGLRAMTLCLAVLPVLTIPFLMGGVSWQEALLSLATNFSLFCWALAAGLLASSWTKAWLRSLVGAMALAAFLGLFFVLVNCLVSAYAFFSYVPALRWSKMSAGELLTGALLLATDAEGQWRHLFTSFPAAAQAGILWAAGVVGILSLAGLALALQITAGNVRRRWREEPPSARRLWWERTFCTPVLWVNFLRKWMRWKLEQNPIGWLEQRTWRARLISWSWLAILISFSSMGLTGVRVLRLSPDFHNLESFLAWLLAASMAMTAAGSFSRERESGVLELLLVSPLRVEQIINGRLRGIWGQFMPAIGLLFGSWIYLGSAFTNIGNREWMLLSIFFFAVTFLTLPVIGLYFSLARTNFIIALVWTLGLGILAPLLLAGLVSALLGPLLTNLYARGPVRVWDSLFADVPARILTLLFQLALAAILGARLHQKLARRSFDFQQGRG